MSAKYELSETRTHTMTILTQGREKSNESRRQKIKWQMWCISVTEKLTLLMIVISDSVYKIRFPAPNEIELSPWSQHEFLF